MASHRLFRKLGIILCLSLMLGCLFGQETRPSEQKPYEVISADNFEGAIVPEERAAEFVKALTGLDAKDFWTPQRQEVLKLEAAIASYLKKSAAKRSPELWKKLANYKRQYAGITVKGRRQIYANFFCNSFKVDWKSLPIAVDDGGDCFFQVKYDVESGEFSDLQINGEA